MRNKSVAVPARRATIIVATLALTLLTTVLMARAALAATTTTYDVSLSYGGTVLDTKSTQWFPCTWSDDEVMAMVGSIDPNPIVSCESLSVDDDQTTSVTAYYSIVPATQGDPEEGRSVTLSVGITSNTVKDDQYITAYDIDAVVGEIGRSVEASTTGDGALSYAVAYGEDVVSVNQYTGALNFLDEGTATITIYASETNDYNAASGDIAVTVTVPAPTTYTVAYDKNASDATGTMKPQEIGVGQRVKLTANLFTRSGWSFVAWNTKKDGTGTAYQPSQGVTNIASAGSTVTLYAQWKKDAPPKGLTLSFDKNASDATGTMKKISATKNETVTLPANRFSRSEWSFSGWNTKRDGTGKAIQDGTKVVVDKDMTLYAQWDAWHSVTVSGNIRNGSVTVDKTKAQQGDTVRITVSPGDGYVLDSLSAKDSNGGNIPIDAKRAFTMPEGNVTVDATFVPVKPKPVAHAVTITVIGPGKAAANPTSGEEGQQVTLSATPDQGCEFVGWKVVSGHGARLDRNKLVMGDSDVTVEASFKKIAVSTPAPTVSTSAGNGTVSRDAEVEYTISQRVPDDATYVRVWIDLESVLTYTTDVRHVIVRRQGGGDVTASKVSVDGRRLTVTMDDSGAVTALRGTTIQVVFRAKVANGANLSPYLDAAKTVAALPYQAHTAFRGAETRTADSALSYVKVRDTAQSQSDKRKSSDNRKSGPTPPTGDSAPTYGMLALGAMGLATLGLGVRRRLTA